jgi:hypothetical protein
VENAELLMHLAEIAGVFVGFGALISVRNEAIRDEEVMMIRLIVISGILVIVAGLLPVVLNGFGVADHGLWATSAGVFLILWWGSSILNRWDVERTRVLAAITSRARMRMEAPSVPLWLCMNAALVLILTGRLAEWEPALYLAAVALNLLLTAGELLYLVYLQRSSRPVGDAAARTEADSSARDHETQPIAEH